MTPDTRRSKHVWSGTLKSLAVGLGVFYLGREMAVWLTVHNVHGFSAFLDNVAAGIAAGLVVFLFERRRQRAVDTLRESEQRFRLVADSAPVLMWMSGTDKLCTYFNKPWLDFTGRSMEQELGNGWAQGVHPEDLQRRLDTYTRSFDRREEFRMEYRLRRHDGEYRWVLDIGVPRFDQDRSLVGYIGICVDVTERRRAEEALRQSEEKFSKLFRGSPVAVVLSSVKDGRFIEVNNTFERFFGYRHKEVIGSKVSDIGIWVDPSQREELTKRLLSEGSVRDLELRFRTKNGDILTCLVSAEQIEVGSEHCILSVTSDITERKLAEEALRETNVALEKQTAVLQSREELLKIFVKNVPAGVAMFDREMRYLQASERWCADYGLDSSQIVERSHYELFPDLPLRWKEIHRRALQGETLRAEEDRWDRADGSAMWIYWVVRPWLTLDGTPGGILIFAEDITHRKQAEETLSSMTRKLIESQEQERARIGRELHDDINQRLAMLSVEIEQLRENPSEIETRLQELRKEIGEISNDVQGLSHDLHSSRMEYLGAVAGMKSWCREFAERQKLIIDFNSTVSSAVPREIGVTLFRVLQEGLQNAVKYSGAKRVEVQLREDSGEIHLVLSDSGKGFEVEAALQGKGLGLTSMQERVRLVGGAIMIDSKPPRGTTIHVRVPLGTERGFQRAAG